MPDPKVKEQVEKIRKAGHNVLSQSAPAQVAKQANSAGNKIKKGLSGMFK